MARFHIHRLSSGNTLVLDLQADLLDSLNTRMVAPVVRIDEVGEVMVRLTLRVEVSGGTHLILMPSMASIPTRLLGPSILDLSDRRDEIIAATDFLFQGF